MMSGTDFDPLRIFKRGAQSAAPTSSIRPVLQQYKTQYFITIIFLSGVIRFFLLRLFVKICKVYLQQCTMNDDTFLIPQNNDNNKQLYMRKIENRSQYTQI